MKEQKEVRVRDEKAITRRRFMQASAAVAAFTIVPRHVLGGAGQKPPSEKLNIASIGAGGMARANIDNCSGYSNAPKDEKGNVDTSALNGENIVALCDADYRRAADGFKIYPKAKRYEDFRKMLEKEGKNIDAVIVACPDHIHAAASIMAMKMGKGVYCQKPLTHSVYEARRMAEVAKQTGVATQMGNQGHSDEQIRLEREWIQDGAIGKVHTVYAWTNRPVWPQGIGRPSETPPVPAGLDWDLWLGPAPKRPYNPAYLPFVWRGWMDFGTGALVDMGCHIIYHAYYALGLTAPTAVEAYSSARVVENWRVMENNETYPDASIVRYEFGARGDQPAVTLTWFDGGLKPPTPAGLGKGRTMPDGGVIFVGEKGAMMEGRLIPEQRMREYQRPAKTIPRVKNGSAGHEQNWIEACKGGPAACSNFSYAGPLTEAVLLGNVSLRLGRRIEWDSANAKVTNVPEANELIKRVYRPGWSL